MDIYVHCSSSVAWIDLENYVKQSKPQGGEMSDEQTQMENIKK